MKKPGKLWIYQIPVIALFSFAFWVVELGERGDLDHPFLRDELFPSLRRVSALFTDFKFKARGPQQPKNKVVIVDIDSESIETFGRWPWHRDYLAYLIERTFQSGAKVVGLDIVFSEHDQRVPDGLMQLLAQKNLIKQALQFETDPVLRNVIERYQERLVLGWTSDSTCQPSYHHFEECPVTHPDFIQTHPQEMQKFSYSYVQLPTQFNAQKSPLVSLVTFIPNIPSFNQAAKHAGSFNAFPDPDGYIRRTPLVLMADGNPYPTLALEMARVGLNEDLEIKINKEGKVEKIGFFNSKKEIAVSPLGSMEINFRGPSYSFPYVSALEVMSDSNKLHHGFDRSLASDRFELFKDAYVLIGLSAVGVYDMRAFPFDSNTPGVEGHATILDNILAGDYLQGSTQSDSSLWIFLLMIFGALLFAYAAEKLESIPGLLLFLGTMGGISYVDLEILFEANHNLTTSFLFLEVFTIFTLTIVMKYVLEEKNKKFIKDAFSKYVAPAVVDSIVKDPDSLSLGGEKKEITILFSDIRGFTTLSEKMDPKLLSKFLNTYLGEMTDIIFNTKGTLDKYIGDAVMAFWGAPVHYVEHGKNACEAAIQMQQALDREKEKFRSEFGIDVEVGIGVHSGTVSVGNMGSETNFNYTVLGDDVNLASRIEGLTKYYRSKILTTRQTLNLIEKSNQALPPHRTLDFVKVKGKKQAVEIIQILDQTLPEEGLSLFKKAREHYLKKQWDDAIKIFTQASEALEHSPGKGDGPSEMYIERCETMKKDPPASDWDGSWEMTSK